MAENVVFCQPEGYSRAKFLFLVNIKIGSVGLTVFLWHIPALTGSSYHRAAKK